MKKNLLGIGLSALFLLFSGCSHKELSTSNYYPNYTKDEILLAGKYVFLNAKPYEYVIDSYRDRLEVTRTGLLFHTLHHRDYLLKVQEDECGTLATLVAKEYLGVQKKEGYSFFGYEPSDIWEKIDSFTGIKDPKLEQFDLNKTEEQRNIFIKPTKDMSTCIIKSEFENGLIKESVKNAFDDHNENH